MLKLRRRSKKTPNADLTEILRAGNASPVLVDIGAAGASPEAWRSIAARSTLVGFEPDNRNPDSTFGKGFANAVMVGKVVVPDDRMEEATLILTEYPSCSSLLEPDLDALSSFSFRDYFKPVDRRAVPATSLNRLFSEEAIVGANWLKLDSQGLDKSLLASIAPEYFAQTLAVDIEPGFIDAYKGEDLYPECHAWLKDHGFWLAELKQQSYAKVTPESIDQLSSLGLNRDKLLGSMRKSPTAAEALYFREVSWMALHVEDEARWAMAVAFGLSQGFAGYCADLVFVHRKKFGDTPLNKLLQDHIVSYLDSDL